jgi:hypothetical protein
LQPHDLFVLEYMRPTGTITNLAAVMELTGYEHARASAVRALVRRLGYQHTALPTAYQANIPVIAKPARTFAPGAGFRRILHDRHHHNKPPQLPKLVLQQVFAGARQQIQQYKTAQTILYYLFSW